jgi:hypothetical protein
MNKKLEPSKVSQKNRDSVGEIAEENPDLSVDFIMDILIAQQEVSEGNTTLYGEIKRTS